MSSRHFTQISGVEHCVYTRKCSRHVSDDSAPIFKMLHAASDPPLRGCTCFETLDKSSDGRVTLPRHLGTELALLADEKPYNARSAIGTGSQIRLATPEQLEKGPSDPFFQWLYHVSASAIGSNHDVLRLGARAERQDLV